MEPKVEDKAFCVTKVCPGILTDFSVSSHRDVTLVNEISGKGPGESFSSLVGLDFKQIRDVRVEPFPALATF